MTDSLHLVCPHCDAVNRIPTTRLTENPVCGQCKKALFVGQPLEVSTGNFDRHLQRTDLPLLIDFWAPWCGPCRMMAPTFAKAAEQLEPQVRLLKVNTESEPDIAARFAIRSIPTLAIFRQGREIARQPGAMDAGSLMQWVKTHL